MDRIDTLYLGGDRTQRIKTVPFLIDEKRVLAVDLSADRQTEAMAVESASWCVLDHDPSVRLSVPATAATRTQVVATGMEHGLCFVQATIRLTNGKTLMFLFRCPVAEPDFETIVNAR